MTFVKAALATVALLFLMGQGCATGGPDIWPGAGGLGGVSPPQCEPPTYPTLDTMGNRVCRDPRTGRDVSVAAGNAITGCPNGAHPTMDSMGNRVCRNDMTGQTFYDTSKGCPMGTHQGADNFGRPACVRN